MIKCAAAALGVVALALLLASCGAAEDETNKSPRDAEMDSLRSAILDQSGGSLDDGEILFDMQATGTSGVAFPVPESVSRLRFYVTCAPAAEFTVLTDGGDASDRCSPDVPGVVELDSDFGTFEGEITIAEEPTWSVVVVAADDL